MFVFLSQSFSFFLFLSLFPFPFSFLFLSVSFSFSFPVPISFPVLFLFFFFPFPFLFFQPWAQVYHQCEHCTWRYQHSWNVIMDYWIQMGHRYWKSPIAKFFAFSENQCPANTCLSIREFWRLLNVESQKIQLIHAETPASNEALSSIIHHSSLINNSQHHHHHHC